MKILDPLYFRLLFHFSLLIRIIFEDVHELGIFFGYGENDQAIIPAALMIKAPIFPFRRRDWDTPSCFSFYWYRPTHLKKM